MEKHISFSSVFQDGTNEFLLSEIYCYFSKPPILQSLIILGFRRHSIAVWYMWYAMYGWSGNNEYSCQVEQFMWNLPQPVNYLPDEKLF